MDLTLQIPGEHLFIRSVTSAGIQVVDDWYQSAIVLSASRIIPDWTPKAVDELKTGDLETILELNPEVVLLGTGNRQKFLPPELMMFFYGRQVGIEVMTTHAACRTFNVLVSESRKVVAALFPP